MDYRRRTASSKAVRISKIKYSKCRINGFQHRFYFNLHVDVRTFVIFFIFVSSKGPALGYHYHAPILEVSGTSRESGSVRNNHASTYRSYSQRNAGNS